MNEDEQALVGCIAGLFVTFVFIMAPIFTIWSINSVFGTEIVLNFQNWCAMAWLLVILIGVKVKSK